MNRETSFSKTVEHASTLVRQHLTMLAEEIGARPVGSAGNQRSQRYIARVWERAGYVVEEQAFDCWEWQLRGAELWLGEETLPVRANPFTPPCEATASFVALGTLSELQERDLSDKIALLHAELASEPLFPKNFPFFQVEAHQRLLNLLEEKRPLAVVLVSPRAAPIEPMIEDGDFLLPSVTVPAPVGVRLLSRPGARLTIRIDATLRPSRGANVIARKGGSSGKKIVLCAHFDTKHDTPGALDNAAGVSKLLTLAGVLQPWRGELGLEFIAFNGEDNYAAPGQVAYLDAYGEALSDIALLINVDGVGLKGARNTIAFFACPEPLVEAVMAMVADEPTLVRVEPWPQGDHMVFATRGVPSIAFSSEGVEGLVEEVIHTPQDTVEGVSAELIAEAVAFMTQVVDLVSRDHSNQGQPT